MLDQRTETFRDIEGGVREVNTWYPFPFVVERCGHKISILPVHTDSVHSSLLQVKTDTGEIYWWTAWGIVPGKKVQWRVRSKPVM